MVRVDFSKEFHCGKCGTKFKHGEEKFRNFLGKLILVPPRKDGKAGCPNCNNILRYIPRRKKKK